MTTMRRRMRRRRNRDIVGRISGDSFIVRTHFPRVGIGRHMDNSQK
jgi:hypothetical protein